MEHLYLVHIILAFLKELTIKCQINQTNLQQKGYVNAVKGVEMIPIIDGPAVEAGAGAQPDDAMQNERQEFERILADERKRYEERMERMFATLQEERHGTAPNYARALNEAGFNKLADSDDVDCFLQTFEEIMDNVHAPVVEWAILLCPYLTGVAQLAYFSMDRERRRNYEEVKQTILTRYHLTPTGYMDRFHSATKGKEQTYVDFVAQLERALKGWQQPADELWTQPGYRKLIDGLIVSRLMDAATHITLKREIRKLSHRPAREVAQHMDDFYSVDLRPQQRPRRYVKPKFRLQEPGPDTLRRWNNKLEITCWSCNKTGHVARICPQRTPTRCPSNRKVIDGITGKEFRLPNLYAEEKQQDGQKAKNQDLDISTIDLGKGKPPLNYSHKDDEYLRSSATRQLEEPHAKVQGADYEDQDLSDDNEEPEKSDCEKDQDWLGSDEDQDWWKEEGVEIFCSYYQPPKTTNHQEETTPGDHARFASGVMTLEEGLKYLNDQDSEAGIKEVLGDDTKRETKEKEVEFNPQYCETDGEEEDEYGGFFINYRKPNVKNNLEEVHLEEGIDLWKEEDDIVTVSDIYMEGESENGQVLRDQQRTQLMQSSSSDEAKESSQSPPGSTSAAGQVDVGKTQGERGLHQQEAQDQRQGYRPFT